MGLAPCISDWAEKDSFVSLGNRWFPVAHCYGRRWYRSLPGQVMLFSNSYTCSELRKRCSLWKQPVKKRRYPSISPQGSNSGKCIKEGANKKHKIPSLISTVTAKKKKKLETNISQCGFVLRSVLTTCSAETGLLKQFSSPGNGSELQLRKNLRRQSRRTEVPPLWCEEKRSHLHVFPQRTVREESPEVKP